MNLNESRNRASTASSFLALSCVGLFASAAPAIAQSADQAASDDGQGRKLGGVVVTDTAIDEQGYKVDKPDSPKYTAPLVDTPRSITVIPASVIKDTASVSLTEALRTVPGITLGAGEGGNPLGDRPFIRGFDSQASTYLDGVRDIGAQSREIFAIEQIEVVKGSDSTTGGRGGAGGSLNLVSKAPRVDRFIAASASVGNADYKRATIDINQPLSDLAGIRLNAMWHDQDVAGRDAIWSKRWGIAPSLKIGMDGPTSLTLGYYHLHTNELPDSGIPYLYTNGNAPAGVTETGPARDFTTIGGRDVSVPRGAYYGLKSRDFRKTNVDNFTIRAEHDFGGVTLRNTSRYGRSTQGYVWTQPDDQQGNVYGTNAASPATAGGYVWRRVNSRYSETKGLLNQTDLFGEFSVGGIKNSFAASIEFSEEKVGNGSYVSDPNRSTYQTPTNPAATSASGVPIATGSNFNPRCTTAMLDRYNCTTVDSPNANDPWVSYYGGDVSSVLSPIQRSLRKTWTLSKTTTKAASLFDTITISDQLLINLGGRFDRYETSVSPGIATDDMTSSRSTITRKDDLWTYQAGIVFKPTENSSIYASTSTSATPPGSFLANGSEANGLTTSSSTPITPQELTDALKVEKTKSYEIGAKANLFGDSLALTLAAFHTETKNARATGDAGTVVFVGERRIKGIEFGFNGNITPEWNVFGGYTYMDSKIVDAGYTATSNADKTVTLYAPAASAGRQFPNTPKHSLTAFTNYKITPAFTVGGGAIYMSKVYGGYSDTRIIQNNAVVITKSLARMVPSYWRFDANASYSFNDAVSLQVNVNNVFNKRYYDKAYAAHYANQAAGRTAIATLNIKY
ncbi:TonB-dependent receptor [Sphingobium baderi]|uniref:TonB-denpendent receptor n=1 Tax=Sphingobium baderi LL03 TaxID=1114964 RepID=T0HIP5_9SPHN|nr:TonB-dependent receptor [Sphingobium baderi]EQA97438.1 TonB-denpendent receptor [Sphingobium baderi LL03]